ncbi:unnamed protein product [Microthlaspi erraticum]|uniref:Aspartic peptidase DDI1-type domain-containing protein n=1 Tax=Microthlaspi erraticum TaxID=1685480 RepID=A0A6D2JU67_9BRAS|nr:unnamed protein product [Microthlaspi erraticum]
MDSMSEAFDQMQMVKDVLANSDKVSEVLQESTHQFNLLTSPTFLPKVKDQGKFTLPCTLGHLEIDNALVDSGASINLISLSMAEKLGIAGALQRPTDIPLFYMLFIWFYYAFHKPAERTRPDRKGIGFARPSPGPIRPHDRTVRPGRQWTTIDRDHHITADPDGRPHALHGRPDVREQEAHLCSFDNSQPS